MNDPFVNIVDLPDEILLIIFKNLNHLDVLYSLVGVNQKLDNVACDINFTRVVDLLAISSNVANDSITNPMLDRFCMHILPRIHNKVECLTVEACCFQRVVHAGNYLHLRKLTLVNLELNLAFDIFNEKSPFILAFKHQISDLIVAINYEIPDVSTRNLLIDIYDRIFALLANLKYLDLDVNDTGYHFYQSLLNDLSSTTCFSSSIVHLRIKMHNFDDCLCLLDGRLSQLHTLIVKLEFIHDPQKLRLTRRKITLNSLKLLNNTKNLSNLKCFSLYAYHLTSEFDSLVLPLLYRMSHLEKLTLSLRINERTSFIDGSHLDNYVSSQMLHLHTFMFDIVTQHVYTYQHYKPSFDDIRRTFIQRGYLVDGYIDYSHNYISHGRCHVYSLPSNMERIQYITHSFPGGMFINVHVLYLSDCYSFEHDFFARISCSFPFLTHLIIYNKLRQMKKPSHQLVKSEEIFSIIEYSHLVELDCGSGDSHIDYVEQFLSNLNTRLPCLSKLHVKYQHLVTVTENFTRNETRVNCIKLKKIIFYDKVEMVYSKDYYDYFPLL